MTDQQVNARLDEILGEEKREGELLHSAVTSLRVLREICETSMEDVEGDPFAALSAFQDATKGIVDTAITFLEDEINNRRTGG